MSVIEKNALIRAKDATGDSFLIYPITKAENVDGLDDKIVQSDWSQTDETAKDFIKNKPDVMEKSNPVATGSFSMNRQAGTTIGNYSHAEGQSGTASGTASHAEGRSTRAIAAYSHAEGIATQATASSAHAEGYATVASGAYSHAEGQDSKARGLRSHAEGYHTIARGDSSHVQGKCNIDDSEDKYAHIVGNGTSDSNRSNAHTLDWEGNAWFAGNVKVGGTSYDDADDLLLAKDVINEVTNTTTETKTHEYSLSTSVSSTFSDSNDYMVSANHGLAGVGNCYKVDDTEFSIDAIEDIYANGLRYDDGGNNAAYRNSIMDGGNIYLSDIIYKRRGSDDTHGEYLIYMWNKDRSINKYTAPIVILIGQTGIYSSFEETSEENGNSYLAYLKFAYTDTNTTITEKIKEELLPDSISTGIAAKADKTDLDAYETVSDSNNKYHESIIGLSVSGTTVTYIKGDGSVHTFETQDTNTEYSLGTDEATGLTKLYATVGSAEDGTMTQKAIKTELDKKVGVSVNEDQNVLIFTI